MIEIIERFASHKKIKTKKIWINDRNPYSWFKVIKIWFSIRFFSSKVDMKFILWLRNSVIEHFWYLTLSIIFYAMSTNNYFFNKLKSVKIQILDCIMLGLDQKKLVWMIAHVILVGTIRCIGLIKNQLMQSPFVVDGSLLHGSQEWQTHGSQERE